MNWHVVLPIAAAWIFSLFFIAYVGYGVAKKKLADVSQMTAEAYKELYEAVKEENDWLKKTVKSFKDALTWQDRRIQRLELHEESKSRLHLASEQQNAMYEDTLAIALPHVKDAQAKAKIDAKLVEIRAAKNKSAREIEEWLESRESLLAFTGVGSSNEEEMSSRIDGLAHRQAQRDNAQKGN